MDLPMLNLIKLLPKVELHLHLEGTLEPELMFQLAEKNHIQLSYKSIDDLKNAYQFHNLQSFLDIYYQGCQVLLDEQDFYDLTYSYLKKVRQQNVRHCEVFFDPQTHTQRGVPFDTVIHGIDRALQDGNKHLGITSKLIMCFLRHLSEKDAFETLESALPYKDKIFAIGLDSSEVGHPPSKFTKVFAKALSEGFTTVAHAGEEGSADYIWEAIKLLKVKRIDHGIRCLDDVTLVDYLKETQIPLTLCPLSNLKLKVAPDIDIYPLKDLLYAGLCITLNSDDPAYFGGYIEENYIACYQNLQLSKEELLILATHAIDASFMPDSNKMILKQEIKQLREAF